MRYFDLDEVVKFITYINENDFIQPKFKINRQFDSIQDIDMISIKEYYIKLLKNKLKQHVAGDVAEYMSKVLNVKDLT